jgi:hypothetical protein
MSEDRYIDPKEYDHSFLFMKSFYNCKFTDRKLIHSFPPELHKFIADKAEQVGLTAAQYVGACVMFREAYQNDYTTELADQRKTGVIPVPAADIKKLTGI